MSSNHQEFDVEEFKNSLIAKAIEDPAYKERLLSDAKAVVEKELGTNLPSGVTIEVVQQSSNQLYLLLPPEIDENISDEELEAVTGGGGYIKFVKKTVKKVVEPWT
ncbi:NHLP leader peptide family natural product precursor [Nostoc sp. FACHB-87]|uniref:NHLP leader peptide family RiPP precursor n=1 Tax=Nostocaceae TaxID=1162 RepID=UPI0016831576|nr:MULTISPECIES: NHLP leader peptide family RiPP precursor [Nostocaceae]MBD2299664.1 NHLP leader peptide family natural product precursor [Nostoc sp. FACHB-190]MBD2457488.1 NHLP leader peptide family natural product precursor [Nostoc sp. FACHB-87]MBD2477544.1 NHLP leader peptide family natural product precursor [Anabaena sp. FACHB-83]